MTCVLPFRLFHSSSYLRTAVASAVSKSLLGQLRKSTGYSISHCKKALQLHNNDLEEANKWLAAQAQSEGWAKATKLAGRRTSQGVLGISITNDNTQAAMMELNCETDFVARNSVFVELATELTKACLAANSTVHMTGSDAPTIQKEMWNTEQVSQIHHPDGKKLADKVALSIGLLGENMILTRAMKISTLGTGVHLYGYTHPGPATNTVAGSEHTSTLLGRYGVVVAVRKLTQEPVDTHVLKHLCLQIIGMNPECIGTEEDLKKYPDAIEEESMTKVCEGGEEAAPVNDEEQAPVITDKTPKDRFLLKQGWLNDEDSTVQEVLEDAGLEVVDFVRMEVGQCNAD